MEQRTQSNAGIAIPTSTRTVAIPSNRTFSLWPIAVKSICLDFRTKKGTFAERLFRKVCHSGLNWLTDSSCIVPFSSIPVDDSIRVIRGCGYINDTFDTIPPGASLETDCIRRAGTFSLTVQYCVCNSGDGCNPASRVSFSYVTLLMCLMGTLGVILFTERN